MKYIAHLDLLGIVASTAESGLYRSKISRFTDLLIQNADLLGEGSKLHYFSDCAYIQADDLEGLIEFLSDLRHLLLMNAMDGTYMTATVTRGKLAPHTSERKASRRCDVQGVSFLGEAIAELYGYHGKFKAAGIWLHEDVVNDLKNSRHTTVPSFFIPEVAQPGKPEEIVTYTDVAFSDEHSVYYFRRLFRRVLHDALSAGNQNPRFGRNYVPLLVTLMRSRPPALEWDSDLKALKSASTPCKAIYELSLKHDRVPDLYGLHYLSLVLLGMSYEDENSFMNQEEKREFLSKVYREGVLSKMYSRISEMPEYAFISKSVNKKIREDYLVSADIGIDDIL